MHIHCIFTVHSLHIHCTFTVHSLYIHCIFTVHSLHIHCTFTVYSLYITQCIFIYTLYNTLYNVMKIIIVRNNTNNDEFYFKWTMTYFPLPLTSAGVLSVQVWLRKHEKHANAITVSRVIIIRGSVPRSRVLHDPWFTDIKTTTIQGSPQGEQGRTWNVTRSTHLLVQAWLMDYSHNNWPLNRNYV